MSEESRAMRAPNALRRPNKFIAYMRKYWFVYMLVLPGLVFMLVFDYGPMYGILLAFKDYSPRLGVWGSPWAGLSHFREMLVDPNFIRAFKNTVLINLYNLAFGFTFNVFLALMINELKIKKVKPVVQTCVYLPYFLSWVIFAGLVQVFLEYPSSADIGGVVNQVISALGGQPVDFLKNPAMFRTILSSRISSKRRAIPPSCIWRRSRASTLLCTKAPPSTAPTVRICCCTSPFRASFPA